MTDKERVLALVEEGKITAEEADRLLAALGDVEGLEADMQAVEQEVERETNPPEITAISGLPRPGTDVEKAFGLKPPNGERQQKDSSLPPNLNWVRVNLLAGDIDISVDDSLSEPVVDGKASVFREGEDFVIKPGAKSSGDSFGDRISSFVGRFGDLNIRIPPGYGVDISSKAGNIDVENVPFLKGNMLAGDIDAKNIGGVDLSLSAGDIDMSLRPISGKHRIMATAGDVDVILLEGSSVHLEGAVSMGDFKIKGFEAKQNKSITGGGFSGRVGEGAATLNIQLSAGDLKVKANE